MLYIKSGTRLKPIGLATPEPKMNVVVWTKRLFRGPTEADVGSVAELTDKHFPDKYEAYEWGPVFNADGAGYTRPGEIFCAYLLSKMEPIEVRFWERVNKLLFIMTGLAYGGVLVTVFLLLWWKGKGWPEGALVWFSWMGAASFCNVARGFINVPPKSRLFPPSHYLGLLILGSVLASIGYAILWHQH